jgi:hypothetical protein
MYDPWIDRLSEHIDGELDASAEATLAQHLDHCQVCRQTLAELQQVRTLAKGLQDTPPVLDIWPAIAARMAPADVVPLPDRRPRRWHVSISVPQLAAAAVILMTLSGGGVWLATSRGVNRQLADGGELAPERPPVRLVSTGSQGYESAIAELQRALTQTATPLDSGTVAVLRQSLATIDAAIADARAALEQDPSNPFLYHHLDGAMKKKVDILRRAVSARRAAS